MTWSELEMALARDGIPCAALFAQAQSVILFGSRAAACASPTSDWDLLCIGDGRSRLSRRLDVVWVAPEHTRDPDWLGSELANHVARWSVIVSGDAAWLSLARPGEQAIERKRRLIQGQVDGMSRVWELLGAPYRTKQLRNLRRDLQRFEFLRLGMAVPPSPMLDRDWSLEPRKWERWQELADGPRVMTRQLETILESQRGQVPEDRDSTG